MRRLEGPILTISFLLICRPGHAQGWLNVKNPPYNAVGDGVANDTAAINQALQDAANARGGTVYFPPGTYKFDSLTFPWTDTGGWVVLLVSGVLAPTSTMTFGTVRYALVGIGSTNLAQAIGQFGPSVAIQPGSLNPVISITNAPVWLQNLSIKNCVGDCIKIGPNPLGGAFTFDNVSLQQSETAPNTTAALHGVDCILIRSGRSSYYAAQTTSPRPPAIWLEGNGNQNAYHMFRDTTLYYGGIKISSTADHPLTQMVFDGLFVENINQPVMTIDSTNTTSSLTLGTSNFTIQHLWNADTQNGVVTPCLGVKCPVIYAISGAAGGACGTPSTCVVKEVHLSNLGDLTGIQNIVALGGAGTAIQGLDVTGYHPSSVGIGQGLVDIQIGPNLVAFAPNNSGLGINSSPITMASSLALGINHLGTLSVAPATIRADAGNLIRVTLSGNIAGTWSFNGGADGQIVTFEICQDAPGGRTWAWPPATFSAGAMTIGATASKCNWQSFVFDSGKNLWEALTPGVLNQ